MLSLLSILLLEPASAQMAAAQYCTRGIGVAAGVTPSRRDWDFTTPGAFAWTMSPTIAQSCYRARLRPSGNRRVAWFSLDLLPLYQHTYRRLGVRAPLFALAGYGIGWMGDTRGWGLQIVTNSVAWGLGFRWQLSASDVASGPSVELRFNVFPSAEPDIQAMLIVRPRARLVAGSSNGTPSLVLSELPKDGIDPPRPSGRERRSEINRLGNGIDDDRRARFGFEVGTMMGLRGQFRGDLFAIGLRAGEITAWQRGAVLQPIGLGYVAVPSEDFRLMISGGTTRRDGEWIPAIGTALAIGSGLNHVHAGLMVGPDYISPDIGVSWIW